jgi:hypothetical protein
MEDLDGDSSVVTMILCQVYCGHAALPELALDAVVAG